MMASEHRWIYIGSIILLVAMLVVGLLTYRQVHVTNQAYKKAQQLTDQLTSAGLPAPNQKQIATTLGTDGGPVCKDPVGALKTALWKYSMSNGATGPGQRPVLADRDVIRAGEVVMSVYCPDKLAQLKDKINQLKLEHTVR